MDYEYEDCYDEINYVDADVDYNVIRNMQQDTQKIKRKNKKIRNKNSDE
jgi:hypothetical protein